MGASVLSETLPKALIAASIGKSGWFTDADVESASENSVSRPRRTCWRMTSSSSGAAPVSRGMRFGNSPSDLLSYEPFRNLTTSSNTKDADLFLLGLYGVTCYVSYVADLPYAGNVDWLLSSSDPIVEIAALSDLPETIAAQLNALRALPKDWDGYGAQPLNPEILSNMQSALFSALRGIDCPSPDLTPGADGSLAAEWHRGSVELIFNIDRHGMRSLSVSGPQGAREYYDEEAVARLREHAARMD